MPAADARTLEERALELGRTAQGLRKRGRTHEAVRLLREAVRLAPGHAGLVGNLANALRSVDGRVAALPLLVRACELDPASGLLAYNLGTTLFEVGRLSEARGALERALALGEIEAQVRVNLGRLDEVEGRLESAAEHWQRAAELAPDLARPNYLLARIGRLRARAPLEKLVSAAETPPSARAEAHFGLGYQLEREGDFARAFEHFRRGNALKASTLAAFDPRGHHAEVERLMRVFEREFFAARPGLHPSAQPIFIVGMPRSGTTLVESILATHSEVCAGGERTDINRLVRSLRPRGYPEIAADLPAAELTTAAEAYLAGCNRPSALRATDKLPGNYAHLGLVARLFAQARIVHCQRDPLDTALSLFCQLFEGTALSFSYDLAHIAAVLRAHDALMAHWRAVLPLDLHVVAYEELVSDPEAHSRALFRAVGIEPVNQESRGQGGPVFTASAWRVRGPVDQRSVGRWRAYARELEPLRAALAR